jgi:hypothetical protein
MSGPLLGARGGRATPLQLLAMLALGVAAGLVVGYVLMGTAHAIMEVGADREDHYKHAGRRAA